MALVFTVICTRCQTLAPFNDQSFSQLEDDSKLACLRQAARWRLVRFNASRDAGRNDENVGQPKNFRRAFIAKIVHYSGVFDESCSRRVVMTYAIRFIERRSTLSNRDDNRARVRVPATIPTGHQRLVRN